MKRRAPKDGYDFGNKRQYRRDVWRFFQKHCPVPRAHAQALLMPSAEGDEIEVALNNGFREENLHVVDANPAIVATLKRRYRKISTYGCDVASVFLNGRIASHVLHVANLDLTGTLGPAWFETCFHVARSLAPHGLIAATYLKGRDPLTAKFAEVRSRHEQAAEYLGLFSTTRRLGSYQSGVSPMEWVAGRTRFALPGAFALGQNLTGFRPTDAQKLDIAEAYLQQDESRNTAMARALILAIHHSDVETAARALRANKAGSYGIVNVEKFARLMRINHEAVLGFSKSTNPAAVYLKESRRRQWDRLSEAFEMEPTADYNDLN